MKEIFFAKLNAKYSALLDAFRKEDDLAQRGI
jgi:hypothetical protein